jgi:hypothetical protein
MHFGQGNKCRMDTSKVSAFMFKAQVSSSSSIPFRLFAQASDFSCQALRRCVSMQQQS